MALLFKALIGAVMVIIMALLAKTKNYYIAGLVPLFPTFAIIAHYIIGNERGNTDLKATALFGIFSLVPYFFYLLSVYLLADKTSLYINLFISTLIWFVFAFILIVIYNRFVL